MRDECRVVGNVMIRRKEGDGRHGRHCGQTQQAIEDCGSGATILRLDHHAARRNVGEEGRIKSFMSAHDDDEDALRRRSEEHTSELQSQSNLVCRLLLEKKKPQLQTWLQT